jgi:DNA polymerase III sliding clamp (beta) subunit (PCNA family)
MEINRAKLAEAVAFVLPGVAKKELFTQADKLEIQGGMLVSYNDEISISYNLGLDDEDPIRRISGAVDGVHLYELLNRITTEKVDIEIADNTFKVNASGGKIRSSLKLLPLALPISEIDFGEDPSPLSSGFKEGVTLVAEICATDMSRPVLTCVNVTREFVEGSDGYRVGKVSCENIYEFLIPAQAMLRIADSDITQISMGLKGEWVHFYTDAGLTISSRLSSSRYPDISSVYNVKGNEFALPEDLLEALERAAVFSYRQHKIDEEVKVRLLAGRIIVDAADDDGTISETILWDRKDIKADFSIHPDFFKKALKRGTKCQLSPSSIKFVGDTWQHVIALK